MTRHTHQGFTLLEVLVMMIIIGITISFITLSIGGGTQARELRAEAERLQGVVQLAREEAILLGRPLGLRVVENYDADVARHAYEFAVYERGEWQALDKHSVLLQHILPESIELDLALDGLNTRFLSDSKSKKDDKKAKEKGGEEKQRFAKFEPDIFFLQSGEFAPAFSISVLLHGSDERFILEGNPLGQLKVEHEGGDS
jgi:general secretion pathway protein H